MRLLRYLFVCLGVAIGFTLGAAAVRAQAGFTTVVVFGDSLSDTGNIAHLTQSATLGLVRYPSDNPALGFDYTDGRFTDGKDTQPAAQAYFGVWVEQLAASFAAKPAVVDSLDGGTNFAYGDATTGPGTTTLSEGPVSITIHNMGQQVTDYLSTSPAPMPNAQTLYVLWGGANDLYEAVLNAEASNGNLTTAATTAAATAVQNEIGYVTQLAQMGATNFVLPNLPPLGAVPSYSSNAGASALNTGAAAFQAGLSQAVATLKTTFAAQGITLQIYQPDLFTLFATDAANPMAVGLGNVTSSAQGISASPDTYLIWDGEHPTTTGHHLAAAAAANLITPLVGSTTALMVAPAVLSGQAATLSAKVTGGGATPTGLVTFFSGTTAIGSAALDGTGTGTTSFTGATGSSPYSLTAVYAGDTTYKVSASSAQPLAVLGSPVGTNTSLNVTLASTATGEQADLSATVSATVSTYGQPSGTVTFYDGTTMLGTANLSNGTASFNTTGTLNVGSHSYTASYAPAGIFGGSTSTAVAETVAAPGFTASANPSSLTIKDGNTGTTTLRTVDAGGFTGGLTPTCGGTLPAHVSCTITALTLPLPVGQSEWTMSIATAASTSATEIPERPGSVREPMVFSATLLFPLASLVVLVGKRRKAARLRGIRLLVVACAVLAGTVMGLSGCGNSPDAPKGTFTIPVTFTPAAGTSVASQTINVSVTVD